MSFSSDLRVVSSVLPLVLLLAAPRALAKGDAWIDTPPFEVPPEVLDAALDDFESRIEDLTPRVEGTEEARANQIAVLLEEFGFSYDEQGRETMTHHRIFRVLTDGGLEGMGAFSAFWEPWHQDRPVVQARVVHADGEVHLLDPDAVVVRGVPEPGQKVYSDARELVAPLPSLEVGAIVEQLVIVAEHRPYCAAGRSHSLGLQYDVPVAVGRLWVEQPKQDEFGWMIHGEDEVEDHVQRLPDDRRRRTFVKRDLHAWEDLEMSVPPDMRAFPVLEYSTASSWNDVARDYLAQVDASLAEPGTEQAARELADKALGAENGAGLEPLEIIGRLLATLREEVRYTGLNLGDAAIVPRSPAETRRRGYGDCKDQSTLLVALLAHVGIEARVALVNTGPGPDQTVGMPGLDGFNHAIVVVLGDELVWIDPSHELVPPGQLPAPDQDRLVLIVDDGAKDLVRTPITPGQGNVFRRNIRVELPFLGAGHVVETLSGTGPTEVDLRANFLQFQQTTLEDVRTSAAAKEEDEAGLESIDHTDPQDLTVPFEMITREEDPNVAVVSDGEAHVNLFENTIFEHTPHVILVEPPPDGPERDLDHYTLPFHLDLRYEVVPPDGYELVHKPKEDERSMGPATYRRTVEVGEDAVVVTFALHWDRARWTPEEVAEARKAYKALGKETTESLVFKHRAQIQREAGDVLAAAATYRQLIQDWPDEPLHKGHLAELLVEIGLVEPARALAAQAAEQGLEVGVTRAHLMYTKSGWIHSHDELGQFMVGDYDREGAVTAWRAAVEQDDEAVQSKLALAITLRHDAHGEPLASDHPDRQEGLQLLRDLRETAERDPNVDDSLLRALVADEVYDEALGLARELPASPLRNGTIVSALSMLEGVDQALQAPEWRKLQAQERQQALGVTFVQLMTERRYQDAAEVVLATAAQSQSPVQARGLANLLAEVVPWEERGFDPDDPVDVSLQLMSRVLAPDAEVESIEQLVSRGTDPAPLLEDGDWRNFGRGMAQLVSGELLSDQAPVDLFRALTSGEVEDEVGDDMRVKVSVRDPSRGGTYDTWIFLVRQGKSWKVRGGVDLLEPEAGAEAFQRAKQGKLDEALRWMHWARGEREIDEDTGPWEGEPWLHLLDGLEDTDERGIRMAAAALWATGGLAPKATKELAQALEASGEQDLEPETLRQLRRALQVAYRAQDERASETDVLLAMLEDEPAAEWPFWKLRWSLMAQDRWEELVQASDSRLAVERDDPLARRCKANALAEIGDAPGSIELYGGLDRDGEAQAGDLNMLAWIGLVEGRFDQDTLRFAQRSAEAGEYEAEPSLHTLASILAEQGKVLPAYEVLRQSLSVTGLDASTLGDHWWYVLGRIAEQLELHDLARAHYARVEHPEGDLPMDTWHLVKRRLDVLAATPEDLAP